jgi:BolA-like protein 3
MLPAALRASARRLRRSPLASRGATEFLRAWPSSSPSGGGSGCACCPGGACACAGCAACGRPTLARAASTSAVASSSSAPPSSSTPTPSTSESALTAKLRAAFPGATSVSVTDTSGGCGTMFSISVTTPGFKNLPLPAQHKAVTAALEADIPHWHGFTLQTKAG